MQQTTSARKVALMPTPITPPRIVRSKGATKHDVLKHVEDTPAPQNLKAVADEIYLVALITDPSKVIPGKKNPDGTPQRGTIVGYRFHTDVPLRIPDFGTGDKFRRDAYAVEDPTRYKNIEAGTDFDLTRGELAAFAGKVGTRITGQNPDIDQEQALLIEARWGRGSSPDSRPSAVLLRPDTQTMGVRSLIGLYPEIPVLNYVQTGGYEDDEPQYFKAKGYRALRPEFEGTKFAPLGYNAADNPPVPKKSREQKKAEESAKLSKLFSELYPDSGD